MKKTTKNLKNLVKKRKTAIVVTKQGSVRTRSRSSGTDVESYCFSNYSTNN